MCEECSAFQKVLLHPKGGDINDLSTEDKRTLLKFMEEQHGTVNSALPLAQSYMTAVVNEDQDATRLLLKEILSEPWVAGNVIYHLAEMLKILMSATAYVGGKSVEDFWQGWLLEWNSDDNSPSD